MPSRPLAAMLALLVLPALPLRAAPDELRPPHTGAAPDPQAPHPASAPREPVSVVPLPKERPREPIVFPDLIPIESMEADGVYIAYDPGQVKVTDVLLQRQRGGLTISALISG